MQVSPKIRYESYLEEKTLDPEYVSYQYYTPITHNESQTHWVVDSPGEGYLLDALALVRYEFWITSAGGFTAAGVPNDANFRNHFSRQPSGAIANINPETLRPEQGYGHGRTGRGTIALRQNFPVSRAIQTATVGINGYQIVEQPYTYIDAMNRMKMSHSDSQDFASMSGGWFDVGDHSFSCKELNAALPMIGIRVTAAGVVQRDVGGAAFAAEGFAANPGYSGAYGMIPGITGNLDHFPSGAGLPAVIAASTRSGLRMLFAEDDENTNSSYGKRLSRMASELYQQAAAGDPSVPVAGSVVKAGVPSFVKVVVYEPVPVSPFAMYPSEGLEKVIPNVRDLSVQFNWLTGDRFRNAVFQGYDSGAAVANAVPFTVARTGTYVTQPQLHLRWFRIPMQIPRTISMSMRRINTYRKQIAGAPARIATNASSVVDGKSYFGVTTGTMSVEGIRLDRLPEYFMIYFKYVPEEPLFTDPSDHNLAITSLQVDLDGGIKVVNANSADLYRIWLSNTPNGTKSSYDEWLKRHCVVVLRRDDLGVTEMSKDKPTTLTIRNVSWAEFWYHPQTGCEIPERERGLHRCGALTNYYLFIDSVWENRELIISADGNAQER